MNLIELVRKVIDIVRSASDLPQDWTDKDTIERWLAGMAGPIAALIAMLVASRQKLGALPASPPELRQLVTTEAELAGLKLPANVIEAAIQLLLFVFSLLR